ncbi:hypothetical protein J2046_003033 [Rhizobium petrolearium]|nr:hypothetical protein [Neorhizobium petrolearium]
MKFASGALWKRSDAPTHGRDPECAPAGFKTPSKLKTDMVAPAHVRVYGHNQPLPLKLVL